MDLNNKDTVLQKALRYCIWLLSRQEYSEKQLREKLQTKQYEAEVIGSVLLSLKQNKYVSNERFTQQKIVLMSQKYGFKRTAQTLMNAGIHNEEMLEIKERLLENNEIEIEDNVAFQVWKKRFGMMDFEELNTPKQKQKQWSYLMYRGFDGKLADVFMKKIHGI